VWWDAEAKRWTGLDVPDCDAALPPDQAAPFIMHADGLGWLYVPEGLKDGPLPAHYEPLESPVANEVYAQHDNPVASRHERPDNPLAPACDPRFPHVLTTYRLTEHHTAGGMSRFLPHLAELQPELFVEISPELAAEVGVTGGDWVTVVTLRGFVEARALVTRRMRPLQISGRTVHQLAIPFHWGSSGPVRGDVANDLIALTGEPNVSIHEAKALTCALYRGRRPPDTSYVHWQHRMSES
jgi:formate dehydrogenase major subunit